MTEAASPGQQITLRFAVIGVIVLAMLIPLTMVDGVGSERQRFFDSTFAGVADAWGNAQNVSGPFLVVPEEHRYQTKAEDGSLSWHKRTRQRVYLPRKLELEVDVEHQMRRRSIYEVPVYTATLRFAGEFPVLESTGAGTADVQVRLDQARMLVGISHTQAISGASALTLGQESLAFASGTGEEWIGGGIHARASAYSGGAAQPFSFELKLKGTRRIGFTPVGGSSRIRMKSSWPHPSFDGAYLPERYDIRADGFTAEWLVHELARELPDSWRVDQREVQLADSFAWIDLFQPVTAYTTVDRAIKYGLLFIALTFLGFICFELRLSLRFHPVQYGVVGIGLVLFYLTLLALSEHLDFGVSYLVATAVLTVLIGWYVWAMSKDAGLAGWMTGILAALYGALYVLLRLEAFALLIGTAVLLLGLFALMQSTRSLTSEAP